MVDTQPTDSTDVDTGPLVPSTPLPFATFPDFTLGTPPNYFPNIYPGPHPLSALLDHFCPRCGMRHTTVPIDTDPLCPICGLRH